MPKPRESEALRFHRPRLRKLGVGAVVPLLEFVRKWADKPEFDGDRPKRRVVEKPMQAPAIEALMFVAESKYGTHEVENLLRDILRKSTAANAPRKLWGVIPTWTARCLAKLFVGYPNPVQNERTNELVNRADFLAVGKR